VQGFKEPALPWYSDQVLPFDITLAAADIDLVRVDLRALISSVPVGGRR